MRGIRYEMVGEAKQRRLHESDSFSNNFTQPKIEGTMCRWWIVASIYEGDWRYHGH